MYSRYTACHFRLVCTEDITPLDQFLENLLSVGKSAVLKMDDGAGHKVIL